MNIFAELIHAVYDFKSYTIFRKNGGGRTFLYALLLNGIYFILSLVLPVMATFFLMGGFLGAAKEVVPDFQLKDGKLWVDETYDIQEYSTSYGGVLLKIDTGKPLTEEITDVDLLAFDQAIVMDAEHMIVKAEGSSPIRVSYAEMDLGDWSRETFLRTSGIFRQRAGSDGNWKPDRSFYGVQTEVRGNVQAGCLCADAGADGGMCVCLAAFCDSLFLYHQLRDLCSIYVESPAEDPGSGTGSTKNRLDWRERRDVTSERK